MPIPVEVTSNLDLISLSELKTRLLPGDTSTANDDVLAAFISDVSEAVQKYIGTPLISPAAAVTVLLDGTGKTVLDLPYWPALTTPALVVVEDDDTLAEGSDEDFVVYTELGWLRRIGAAWAKGAKNISVTYKYGYAIAAVPAPIKRVCYQEVGKLWNEQKQKTFNESGRSFESGNISYFDSGEFMKSSLETMDHYRRMHL